MSGFEIMLLCYISFALGQLAQVWIMRQQDIHKHWLKTKKEHK